MDSEGLSRRDVVVSDLQLLLTASIWGFAFVAQRAGMEHVGPFLFNGVRFLLGASVLVPIILFRRKRGKRGSGALPFKHGLIAGLVLFAGASLQQTGLVYTTAGNAGFITGLYVILVPVLGLFAGVPAGRRTWAGSILAVAGMYMLSTAGSSRMATGDLVVLAGAFFWALHIHLIARYMKLNDPLELASVQFLACSLLSAGLSFVLEDVSFPSIRSAGIPILYGGLVSVGIAYTLQLVAQKKANPAHAAIIMSLETVFAMFGGWLLLGEEITLQVASGGLIMLMAMVISATERYGRQSVRAGL